MSESAHIGVDGVIDADTVRDFAELVASGRGPCDDAGRIEVLRAMEEAKCALEARQAVETVALDASQRAVQAAAGERPERLGRGVAAQVALARRVSLFQGQRLLGLAKVLDAEMPHTMAAFKSGRISQWRATIVARETAMLEREERAQVDEQLAGRIETMGDRELAGAAASLAARLDPASVARRRGKAEEERAVTIRPAPDTMTYVTALLPVAQGVAVHAALTREAASKRATGDPRSQGQVMADTLVERLTGQASAAAVPAAVTVVLSDAALLTGADDDALLAGRHGGGVVTPIPAELARELVLASLTRTTRTTLKRLYQAPDRPTGRAGGDLAVLPGRAGRAGPDPRRGVPHPVVRRPDPSHRPRGAPRRGRPHHLRERPRALRGLQPHQTSPRLDRQTRPGGCGGHHDPHRPPLPITPPHPTTTPALPHGDLVPRPTHPGRAARERLTGR